MELGRGLVINDTAFEIHFREVELFVFSVKNLKTVLQAEPDASVAHVRMGGLVSFQG